MLQRIFKKNVYLFCFFFFIPTQNAFCQQFVKENERADSLFKAQNYEAVVIIYEDLFYIQNRYSDKMLLQLSWIAQKKRNIASYLYWLNLYFQSEPSTKEAEKISTTATTYEMLGHQLSDRKWLSILHHRYYKISVSAVVMGGLILFFSFLIRAEKVINYERNAILVLVYLALSLTFINVVPPIREVVVLEDNTYLMEAASSASLVAGISRKGQKMTLIDEQDTWYEVIWNNQKVFVKKTQAYSGTIF